MRKILLLLTLVSTSVLSQLALAAPSLSNNVQNDKGQQVSLEEFKGRVVYLDFWASWCGPCRKSFPWMTKMHAKYRALGLAVVAVNLDSDKALADAFLAKMPAAFNLRFDPDGDVAHKFDLQGMPSSFVFNKQGELVQTHVGFFTEHADAYENELVTLLKE
ncbi:TlpA family protein disulfide reductase [Shewanella salipaludis]|uniref:TlpA family protein disulfide reductase n=1 Tax=Shewanella salipaludis TaxID=2723052 RepID=A0A972G3A7_9GAMM|nr:TlpA disulfide reductase family protein [Shewanella salipaludis]NMH63645.1 TlpA family protein disulfide reductase [Shewanella salipaludis]